MKLNEWKAIIKHFLKYSNLSIMELITPFGFEVLDSKEFYKYELKRFYIYYNAKDSKNFEYVFREFLKKYYKNFYSYIYLFGSRENGFSFVNKNLKSKGYCICFENKNSDQILRSYSEYISASLFFIARKILPEFQRITNIEMARLRIRQLFLITIHLYKDFIDEEIISFSKTLNYAPSSIEFAERDELINRKDKKQIELIVKYCNIILNKVNEVQENKIEKIMLFGSNDIVDCCINEFQYVKNAKKVYETYIKYHY